MKEIQLYTKELQYRSFFLFLSFLATSLSIYIYSSEYIFFLVQPLKLERFIFTHISEAFQASIEISVGLSILLMIPFLVYQIFCFGAPGFFEEERKYYRKTLVVFLLLSILSLIFSFLVFLPLVSQFFINFEIHELKMNLQLEARILGSIHFIFQIFLVSEILFTIPLVCCILFEKGILKRNFLSNNRKLCYFCILLLCSFLCPPEFFVQCVGSGLCMLIYELLVFLGFVQEFYLQRLNAVNKHS